MSGISQRARRRFLTVLLTGSGVLHFARPQPFVSIVPRMLPGKAQLVAISGVAELACAALLFHPAGRGYGGYLSAALFAAVFPANVSMALRSGRRGGWYQAAAWLRLPLQIPLIRWAWSVGRSTDDGRTR